MTLAPGRFAELVVQVDKEGLDDLPSLATISVRSEPLAGGDVIAVVQSGAMTEEAAELHLSRLWSRATPLLQEFHRSGRVPTIAVLRVVEYVTADDSTGAGVPIDEEWVSAVAALGGSIDVDVYVLD